MRVSEHYNLGRTQPTLEFLDVDIHGDTRVFIDPRAIRSIQSTWGRTCVTGLQSFFDTVIQAIRDGDDEYAQQLLSSLREPNETRLGLSRGRPRGRGMGYGLAERVWERFSQSRAVESGLIEDLEDTALFVEGVGFDLVSDITTNIIRGQLIRFTQDACAYYGIPTLPDVDSGQIWDHNARRWVQRYVDLPVASYGPLILVPKAIVRRNQTFRPDEYYTYFVLPQLRNEEFANPWSNLVTVLANGRRRIYRRDLEAKYGTGKNTNLETTLRNPDILAQYRTAKSGRQQPPNHEEIASLLGTDVPDWEHLLQEVLDVPPGRPTADKYHRKVEALLSALFYPALSNPYREFRMHEGRKRVDITYDNTARTGFFDWVTRSAQSAAGPLIFVECKNYGGEIGNPELDQLAGRFGPNRGRFGLLVYRGYGSKELVEARCRDTALDQRGYIIALDDEDLRSLVAQKIQNPSSLTFPLLRERFLALIS